MNADRSAETLSEVIDMDELLTRCLGNLDFADRILTVFQSRCEKDLVELEQAVAVRDLESIERIAHRLKGACANAAAPRMHERATQLWNAAHRRAPEEVTQEFEGLRNEWARSAQRLMLAHGTITTTAME